MSLRQHYADFKWIKVRRHNDDPNLSCEERLRALEHHHVAETTFLIAEIRMLAARVDELLGDADSALGTPNRISDE